MELELEFEKEMNEKTHVVTGVVQTNAGASVTLAAPDGGDERSYLIKRSALRELGIKEGDEVGAEQIEALESEAELGRAEARMTRILSYSDHSVNLLVRKLVSYGISRPTAERAAANAVQKGYIKENEQAQRCAEHYLNHKYWGKKRIAMELVSRGYCREAINGAIEALGDEAFADVLRKVIAKKFPEAPKSREELEKIRATFCRQGFSVSEINAAIRDVYDDE